MAGNPICVQVRGQWQTQCSFVPSEIPQIPWDNNNDALAKWANANTGFPWIDAIMTQLREEGWIHHLARHAVACFLTRGDLWVSWEEGLKVTIGITISLLIIALDAMYCAYAIFIIRDVVVCQFRHLGISIFSTVVAARFSTSCCWTPTGR